MCRPSNRSVAEMIKRNFLLTLLFTILPVTSLVSQSSRIENKNAFYEAESWILFEAYKDALPLYQQLLKAYPENANIKYRIG